eukprot:4223651-Prymnesium_polylepis.2
MMLVAGFRLADEAESDYGTMCQWQVRAHAHSPSATRVEAGTAGQAHNSPSASAAGSVCAARET